MVKSPKRKRLQPPPKCIFCGKGKLTKEHIWPNWLRDYVLHDVTRYATGTGSIFWTHEEETAKQHPRDSRNRGLGVVCGHCNGGWIRLLQTNAKSILIPLIEGGHCNLDEHSQGTLAAWSCMAIMVGEFFSSYAVAIPKSDRSWLWQRQTPPKNWKIWIGTYRRVHWKGQWAHSTRPILANDCAEMASHSVAPPNTQETTFVIGQLYIHAFSCPFSNLVSSSNVSGTGGTKMAQLWPPRAPVIKWPLALMTDRDANEIAGCIFSGIDRAIKRPDPHS